MKKKLTGSVTIFTKINIFFRFISFSRCKNIYSDKRRHLGVENV